MSNIISSFFYNFIERIRKTINDKVEEIAKRLIKLMVVALIGIAFILLGISHLLTGFVKYFTIVFASEAMAYGLVGIFLILLGIIMMMIFILKK